MHVLSVWLYGPESLYITFILGAAVPLVGAATHARKPWYLAPRVVHKGYGTLQSAEAKTAGLRARS